MISDYKTPFTTSGSVPSWTYLADVKNISNMYPYGKSYGTNAIYNATDDYRYGFNGMEKAKEVDENTNSTHFRNLDLNDGRWWSRDPKEKKYPNLSPYISMGNNPILMIDPRGDEYYIDKYGYILENMSVSLPENQSVFLVTFDGVAKLQVIGMIGGVLDINTIFSNLLKKNSQEVQQFKGIDILDYADKVGGLQEWDLKNNNKTIYGIAWQKDIDEQKDTKFKYKNNVFLSSADVGNYHAGYVGASTNFFQLGVSVDKFYSALGYKEPNLGNSILYYGAGVAETFKDFVDYAKSIGTNKQTGASAVGQLLNMLRGKEPFGDNQNDYIWNKKGMEDGEKNFKDKSNYKAR